MDNTRSPAAHVDWKTSIIPKGAGNPADPVTVSPQELEAVIANPGSLQIPNPIDTGLEAAPRYNANVPYNPMPVVYSPNDKIVMEAIRLAVKNGWNEYTRFANSAVTIGMEAEAVIDGMKKRNANISELLFNKEFCKSVWPDHINNHKFSDYDEPAKVTCESCKRPIPFGNPCWQNHLQSLVVADNPVEYLKGVL
jgi:hypothetical protein